MDDKESKVERPSTARTSRRSFLKGGAAIAGAALVGAAVKASPVSAAKSEWSQRNDSSA
jgi:hypothetical protein